MPGPEDAQPPTSINLMSRSATIKKAQPFTAEEAAHIQARLDAPIDHDHIQFRPSAQGSVAYVEGWKALSLANEVFGFSGWSSEILQLGTDFLDVQDGRVSLGVSCMVRIHLRDGTFHDDIGYGSSENQRSKAAAYEKARKEAVTDAMKRALRVFGNRLGNCAYDKNYLRQVKSRTCPANRPPPPQGHAGTSTVSPPIEPPNKPQNLQIARNPSHSHHPHHPQHSTDHPNPPPDFSPQWQHPRVAMTNSSHQLSHLSEASKSVPHVTDSELLLTEEQFGSSVMIDKLEGSPGRSNDQGMPRTRPKLFHNNFSSHARGSPRSELRSGGSMTTVNVPAVNFRPPYDPTIQK